MVVCLFCVFVCCVTLSDFGLLFLKIEALIDLRKMLLRKKLFDVRLPLRNYPIYGFSMQRDLFSGIGGGGDDCIAKELWYTPHNVSLQL